MENETEVRMVEEVGSTNEELLAAGRAGAAHGCALAARRQTAGRGRRGHAWASPAGNLYLSVVLRPAVGPGRLPGLAAACGLGATDALLALGVSGVSLKWPNDLLARGRKLGGILVEAARDDAGRTFAVCGIGVNVESAPRELAAVSLAELGAAPGLSELARALRDGILSRCDAWAGDPGGRPLDGIRDDYLARLAWAQERVVALSPEGPELARGRLAGVDAWGRAVLDTAAGPRSFSAEQASLRPLPER
ncbi:biotin--[acetyl-CoA-carboxylase] ligase [Olsenella uli]|uniref:biotin--[acetyl-CoA-carboxylase] ligase n=1 Tax=Olsenella uli TaxID=133926 RepID=UPI00195B3D1D|nr:biotin--[acetyl-CoA-carboxylase] ligase [Olsenella uli]MBM6817261.1 biotin--[acetyl-CoA-carboxylase] ligase [Olsenella uli]